MKKKVNPKAIAITKIISAIIALITVIGVGIGLIGKLDWVLTIALVGSGATATITIIEKMRE